MEPTTEPSLSATIERFRARGYTSDFDIDGPTLRCSSCRQRHAATAAAIEDVARFEGASDPDDEAAVFALRCPRCGARGVLVTAYGPVVDADTATVLTALQR
jgi:hypothetical protein